MAARQATKDERAVDERRGLDRARTRPARRAARRSGGAAPRPSAARAPRAAGRVDPPKPSSAKPSFSSARRPLAEQVGLARRAGRAAAGTAAPATAARGPRELGLEALEQHALVRHVLVDEEHLVVGGRHDEGVLELADHRAEARACRTRGAPRGTGRPAARAAARRPARGAPHPGPPRAGERVAAGRSAAGRRRPRREAGLAAATTRLERSASCTAAKSASCTRRGARKRTHALVGCTLTSTSRLGSSMQSAASGKAVAREQRPIRVDQRLHEQRVAHRPAVDDDHDLVAAAARELRRAR